MNVLVIGGGRSGVDAANLAVDQDYTVTLTDVKKETPFYPELNPVIKRLHGPQTREQLEDQQMLIVSPGVKPSHPLVVEARALELPVLSEVEFALRFFKGRIIGITGTNGKSTVTSLAEHYLCKNKVNAMACGNIGRTVSSIVSDRKHPDVLVIELSSYQLDSSSKICLDAGGWTNFSEDHLSYHGDMRSYFLAKAKIIEHCRGKVYIDQSIEGFFKTFACDINEKCNFVPLHEAESLRDLEFLALHDRRNAMLAKLICDEISSKSGDWGAFTDFKGLPYRFQSEDNPHGYIIINDSKATNVDSTLTALKAMKPQCTLLLGGQTKGESFAPISQFKDQVEKIILFGTGSGIIKKDLANHFDRIHEYPTLAQALDHMKDWASVSSPILFSPGCASFDEFDNFEKRGAYFSEHVKSFQ